MTGINSAWVIEAFNQELPELLEFFESGGLTYNGEDVLTVVTPNFYSVATEFLEEIAIIENSASLVVTACR